MSVLLEWVVQPLSLIFSLLLLAGMLSLRRGPCLANWVLLAGVLLLWIASAPWSANFLARYVEGNSVSTACVATIDDTPVVVLGAGLNAYLNSDNPFAVLSPETLRRTLKAVELDNGVNRFYVSGGGQTSRKLSDYMAQVMQLQGIDSTRINIERVSLSTLDNARELAALLPVSTDPRLILVTSQLHLKRATATFEKYGYTICGVGVGTLFAPSAGWVGLLPYIESLEKTTLIWREWLATLWYRWRFAIG